MVCSRDGRRRAEMGEGGCKKILRYGRNKESIGDGTSTSRVGGWPTMKSPRRGWENSVVLFIAVSRSTHYLILILKLI
jgi:hypothetical protein